MNEGLIPQRYARALYKYAQDHGTTAKVYDEMKNVLVSAEANPSLQKVMANPFVSRQDKENLLVAATNGTADDGYKAFVKLVLDHKREQYFIHMAMAYLQIYRKENKIVLVTITTAADLGEEELGKIRALVEKAYKGYTLEFREKVDPELIGGFMIDADSSRLDASVRNEIEQLRQTLLRK